MHLNNSLIKFILVVFCISLVALISFATYREVLSQSFNERDDFAIIKTCRIQNSADISRIFSERFINIPGFKYLYYRPIAAFSYGIDYVIWKLNPFGYHLSNLIWHILVVLSLFILMIRLGNGLITSCLAGMIFTIHPVLIEIVPNMAGRQDIMAALFIVLSLVFFSYYVDKTESKNKARYFYLLLSLLFGVLAFGSVEIAILLPILIFSFTLIFSKQKGIKGKGFEGLKRSAPFFILAIVFSIWRMWILKTPFGGGGSTNLGDSLREVITVPVEYFGSLIYPVHFIGFFVPNAVQVLTVIALSVSIIIIIWRKSAIFATIKNQFAASSRLLIIIRGFLLVCLLFAVIALVLHPLILRPIYGMIEKAYHGTGPSFLNQAIEGQNILSIHQYFKIVKSLFLDGIFIVLILSGITLYFLVTPQKIKHFVTTAPGKLCAFLIIWLSLPFTVIYATLSSPLRHIYIAMIPFSMLVAIVASGSWRAYKNQVRKQDQYFSKTAFVFVVILILSWLAYSPLIKSQFPSWEDNARVSYMLLDRLSEIIPHLPPASNIEINFTESISRDYYENKKVRYARSVRTLTGVDYSIKSWLDVNFPNNNFSVSFQKNYRLKAPPQDVKIDVMQIDENTNRYRIVTTPVFPQK